MNFSSLTFSDHAIKGATKARHTFENDWTISVVSGPAGSGLYGDIQHDTFEVAVFRPNGNMLEDVIPWQTPVQITTLMHLLEMLWQFTNLHTGGSESPHLPPYWYQFTTPQNAMRKIETLMNAAILNGENWQLDNTEVRYDESRDVSSVYLFGNLIADISDNCIILYDGGRRSQTTKSRLNAILKGNGNGTESVFQKNHKWFINYDGITEPFESGALLG